MRRTLTAVVLLTLISAPLAARELHWDHLKIDLVLTKAGDLHVTEHLGYVFNGAWNGGYRNLPLKWVEGYRDITLAQDGFGPYTRGNLNAVGHYRVTTSGNTVLVKWRSRRPSDPPYHDAHVTFVFSYLAQGVVRSGSKLDTLRWNCVFPQRPSRIGFAEATLRLPPGISPDRIRARLATFSSSSHVWTDPQGIVHATAQNLRPGDAMQLQVAFPTGIIPRSFHFKQWVNRVGVWWLGLVILLGGATLHVVRFIHHGHDPDASFRIKYLTKPPEGVDPALAGGLDSVVGLPELLGTILDLARRGILQIEQTTNRVLGIFKHQEITIHRLTEGGPLTPWERTVLNGLTLHGAPSSVNVSDLKAKFYTTIPKFKEDVSKAMVKAGWYAESPNAARGKQIAISLLWGAVFVLAVLPRIESGAGILILAVDLALLLLTLAIGKKKLMSKSARPASIPFLTALVLLALWAVGLNIGGILGLRSAIVPIVAAVAVTVLGLIFSPFMPRRTPAGAEIYEKVRALGRYLKHLHVLGSLEEARDRLDELLPYAVALGLDRSFLAQMEPLGEVPMPHWYVVQDTGSSGPSWGSSGGGMGTVSLESLSNSLSSTLSSLSSARSSGGRGEG